MKRSAELSALDHLCPTEHGSSGKDLHSPPSGNFSDFSTNVVDLPGTLVAVHVDGMSRITLIATIALLAGCATSDSVTTDVPPGASGANAAGAAGGDGRGGDDSDDGDDDDDDGGDGDGDGDGGDASTSSNGDGGDAGGESGGGDTGGAASTGSGMPSECGDGEVAADEECDDGNAIADDGCTACVIDCEPQGAKHPVTGNCFRVFSDATTWPFAEANCAAWGGSPGLGHLASIADDAEQDLVFALISAQTWIGVQDPVTEGVYQWSDGSFWDYEHWAPGEPDNTHEEDCAFMRTTDDGGWNDHACGDTRPAYICERRGAGTF